jgi:glucuronosyltransferase
MLALAERGHQVTVYNTFPKETNVTIPNYAEVSLKECFKIPSNTLTIENMSQVNDRMAIVLAFKNYLPREDDILNCKPLIDLASSTERYDLMITEAYFSDFFLTFASKMNIPVILLRCNTVLPWMSDYAGVPHNPSYVPHIYSGYTQSMNFLQRLQNTIYYLQALYLYEERSEKVYDQIASKFFGVPMPPLDTLTRNASMLFLNTHFTLNEVRPLPPNVIEIGGLNIRPPNKLPEVGL